MNMTAPRERYSSLAQLLLIGAHYDSSLGNRTRPPCSFDDFQVLQRDPACRVGHVCDPGPAAFNALYPYDLALHHSHFTCHVVLLCDRSLTVYLDTLLRDPAPLPTRAFAEHPAWPFIVPPLHNLQLVTCTHGQRIRILCLVAGNDKSHRS